MKKVDKLFIVDDDEVFTYLTSKTIGDLNLVGEISLFQNGREAIDYLKKNISIVNNIPDVILLDLSMPILDGWGFLEELKEFENDLEKKIIIYVYTSSISPFDMHRAKEYSLVKDYIVKPVTQGKLIDFVKTVCFIFEND